jgi:ubiquinone/menaquinone biosynthesis C-methylase UbiE
MVIDGGNYTPGVGATAVGFMAERTVHSHAGFVLGDLEPGMSVVDVGCGPGTITVGLATAVAPGSVLGVDRNGEQLAGARARAAQLGLTNVRFAEGSCYQLPLDDNSVDLAFSHALLEHLSEPVRALAEMRRALRSGGLAAVCSPDWGGFILSPPTAAVEHAVRAYTALMEHNGGDPLAGRRLCTHLATAGFDEVRTFARYEQYADPAVIAGYLAGQLLAAGQPEAADALTGWATDPAAMFAQAWVSARGIA